MVAILLARYNGDITKKFGSEDIGTADVKASYIIQRLSTVKNKDIAVDHDVEIHTGPDGTPLANAFSSFFDVDVQTEPQSGGRILDDKTLKALVDDPKTPDHLDHKLIVMTASRFPLANIMFLFKSGIDPYLSESNPSYVFLTGVTVQNGKLIFDKMRLAKDLNSPWLERNFNSPELNRAAFLPA